MLNTPGRAVITEMGASAESVLPIGIVETGTAVNRDNLEAQRDEDISLAVLLHNKRCERDEPAFCARFPDLYKFLLLPIAAKMGIPICLTKADLRRVLHRKKVAELKKICNELKIEKYKGLRKRELSQTLFSFYTFHMARIESRVVRGVRSIEAKEQMESNVQRPE